MLACDFFTVETPFLKMLHVPFFIASGTRGVHFAECTAHPTAVWVAQQACNLARTLREDGQPMR